MTNTNNNHSDYDDDTDSDDELGAMIYLSSRTAAKLRAEEAARNIKEDESKPKPTHKRGAHTLTTDTTSSIQLMPNMLQHRPYQHHPH